MSTTTNLARPRTAPGPLSLWRLLLTGGHWPGHLGLVAAHSVAGEDAAAVFDVGAAAAHTGDTLDNTALLPCPAQLMRQGTRHRGTHRPTPGLRNITSLKITFLCKYHITVVLV